MNKIKVLHVASWFPSREHETLGNFVERHVEAISTITDSKVVFAAPSKNAETLPLKKEGFEAVIQYFIKKLPLVSLILAYKKAYKKIKQSGFEPDLVHLHVVWPAGLFCLLLGKKFVVTEHFTGYHKNSPTQMTRRLRWITKKVIDKSAYIFPVSNHLGKAIQDIGVHAPFLKISNVVDTNIFKFKETGRNDKFRLLHVSSLSDATKNISGILKAFKNVLLEDTNFELWIGGDGDLKWLNEKIKELEIPRENIKTFGTCTPEQVAKKMQQTHAFVLFSNIENQPVVILESLCSGRPIISTKVGGIHEELDNHNGILIEPKNQKALEQAILGMKSNYHLYLGKYIAEKSQEKYGTSAIANAYLKAYQAILG